MKQQKEKESYETYKALYGPLFDKELENEEEVKAGAERQLQQALDKNKREERTGAGKLASKFTQYTWKTCRENMQALVESIVNPTAKTQGTYRLAFEKVLPVYKDNTDAFVDMLVLTGLSVTIDKVFCAESNAKEATISSVANAIGSAVLDETNLQAYMNTGAKDVEFGMSKRVQVSYKKAYLSARMRQDSFTGIKLNSSEKQTLGAKVLECVVTGSGYFELVQVQVGTRKLTSVSATDWFRASWESNENHMIANAVKQPPMLIPPKHWENGIMGGYYGACALHTRLIRIKPYQRGNKAIKTYNKKLNLLDMSVIYTALNAMQDTPFVINKFILQTLQEIVDTGGDKCGVPRFEPLEMPPKISDERWNAMTKKEQKDYRAHLTALYKQERSRQGKALRFNMELQVAKKYAEYPRIYFPWNIDYRGRMYPMATVLSPQGDDIGKSLLLFAEGHAIKEEDTKWMKIHGANLAGHDKVSFAERCAWIDKHTTDIVASADDPLGYVWWYEESKGDYPLEFLAFCNEWKKLQEWKETHQGKTEGFVSNLPLAFDGTCSGLQHFSALLRDEVGGKAVNLIPSDTVQDIYGIVAEKVNKVLLSDAKCGMEDSYKTDKKTGEVLKDSKGNPKVKYGTKTLAQNWVVFDRMKFGQDGITRKVCKRSVMTLAYGSRQYGFKENLLTDIIKPFAAEHEKDNPFISENQAAVYMAKLIWDAVQTTVVKAVEGMTWLQKIAELISKSGERVTWLTPNNLLVQQNYMKTTNEVVQLRFNGARVRFYHEEESSEVDSRGQAQGIAPNFIHSMDATHMQRVVCREHELGNTNFMMIHDSFGTDASRAGELYKVVREEFVKLYKDQNHLQNFLDSVSYLISDEDKDKIPAIPKFGKLNLDVVLHSDFCFA